MFCVATEKMKKAFVFVLVKPCDKIIGSHVMGRVLFSKPEMALCVLTGANLLAYVPCSPDTVLDLESEHKLIVQK